MPGPANNKKKRKANKKKQQQRIQRPPTPPPSSSPTPDIPLLTSPFHIRADDYCPVIKEYITPVEQVVIPEKPFIYDPGNGPRVRDAKAFLESKFFAQPPALNIPLCAEFAQDEVLEMIRTVLPEELALILWYNKSRATSRICPACQRLYRLGDTLAEHLALDPDQSTTPPPKPDPRLHREQEISGLCSPVCFILSAFNYPGAIQSAWGRTCEEIDETSWSLLNGPGDGTTHSDLSRSLEMMVKMTRLDDLGLAQLCFSDDEEEEDDIEDSGVDVDVEGGGDVED